MNELQSRLQSLSFDHDRHLTSIQQTHEEEKQLLLQQLQDVTNQMKDLEKDLFYYKHKTRELRKSMATSISNGSEIHTGLHSGKRSTSAHQS